jgi:UDP:flavonoid glycosyltransferase YjiC (YdhE family)
VHITDFWSSLRLDLNGPEQIIDRVITNSYNRTKALPIKIRIPPHTTKFLSVGAFRGYLMRIVILALGTRGDLESFLILGGELRRRGHQVILGTSPFHAARVQESGLEWEQVGVSTQDQLLSILRGLSAVRDKRQRIQLYFGRWLQPQLAAALPRITTLAAGADYFISNLKLVLSRQGKIVPGAAVSYDPPGSLEELPKYGTGEHDGMILDLVAMSQPLVDPQDQWGEQYRFTGFWQDERPCDWHPPAELIEFLDGKSAPVVMTMGSMVMFDAAKLVQALAEALRQTGLRGIVVEGWSEIPPLAEGDRICRVREVRYDWLFPQACCVVHHGGCGTAASVLRAGIPSIVLPQVDCQEQLAKMLVRENLATGVLDVHTLRPQVLAAAIHAARNSAAVRQSAQTWQKRICAEPGVRAAADWIEKHYNEVRHRASPPCR